VSSSAYNFGVFRAERPRIRDVDVEVVAPGADGAIEPASEELLPTESLNNGTEWRSLLPRRWKREVAPSSSPEPGFRDAPALNGNAEGVLEAELETIEPVESPPSAEPILFETAIDESPQIEVPPPREAVPDVDVEVHEPLENPPSRPRRKSPSRPWRKRTRAKNPASAAPPEMSEPVESPASGEPPLFETAIDESPAIEVPPPTEALPDVDIETHESVEKPPSRPSRKSPSRPRRKRTRAKKPASAAPPETSEPKETPAVEKPAGDEPESAETTGPESPPSLPQRPKARVVWSPAPAAGVQRTHTLKLTKPAPSRSIPETSMPAREPIAKPPSPPRTKPPAREVPRDADVEALVDPAPAAPATREQTCDILFWRGYRKAAFYGRTFDETGEAVAVAESPFFRPQGDGAPEPTEAAKAAYDALRSQLVAAGWEPVSTGDAWFEETFRLTGAVEPEPE
jgi:hypothetical protein